jgi:hypothetical protein
MKTHLKNRLLNRVSLLGNTLQYTAAASLIALSTAHAAVIDWKSNAGSVTWATGTNWVGDVAPAKDLATDIARFNQTSYAFQPQATVAVAAIPGPPAIPSGGLTKVAMCPFRALNADCCLAPWGGGLTNMLGNACSIVQLVISSPSKSLPKLCTLSLNEKSFPSSPSLAFAIDQDRLG